MIGFPLGLLYANAGEWLVHKHVLHGLGKHKKSFFAYHWHEHHREARRNGNHDVNYTRSPWSSWNSQTKELLGLVGLALAHVPLFPIAPWFTSGVWFSIWRYHRVHRRAHLDPAWAREHLPWHVDHHLGPNQDSNWCVTWPFFDILMGTADAYIGTQREIDDQKRAQRVNVAHTVMA